jgi:uncharacterized coiled-coil protein SlyX
LLADFLIPDVYIEISSYPVTRMANETNEMSLDRNLVKNQQRINELEKQLELKESTISNLKKVIEQKDELWIATNDKVLDLEQKKTDIEEALVNLTIDEPGMDYFFQLIPVDFKIPSYLIQLVF